MSNVERGLEVCRRRKQEYLLASIRCLVKDERELFSFWWEKCEEEKEKEGLFMLFKDVLDRSRPVPDFLSSCA